MPGSSGANPFACIAAGIASLWGPAHGGANEAVLKMLAKIGDKSKIPEFIKHVKNKNEHEIQFGFGHRVYKNYDPRARVLRDSCHEVLDELGIKDEPLLDLAMELEKISLNDDYFISRKLYPNVDFYSGIILKAMGFPTSMFTALFAIARTVGVPGAVDQDDRGSRTRGSAGRASPLPARACATTSIKSGTDPHLPSLMRWAFPLPHAGEGAERSDAGEGYFRSTSSIL